MKKLFGKTDFLIVISVLALSLLLLIPSFSDNSRLTAQIIVDGEVTEEIDLDAVSDAYTFSPKDGTAVTVEKGRIRFSDACCEDELCIGSGWLSAKGQTAACLPERIVIAISGTDKTDMMTY